MIGSGPYVAGWLDSTVRDFLRAMPRKSASTAYALLTCLDSNPAVADILHRDIALRKAVNGVRRTRKAAFLPTETLLDGTLMQKLFFGFDEIWFFHDDHLPPKLPPSSLVGPHRVDQSNMDTLSTWMMDYGCSLGLGDGDGLNFVVKAHGLVRHLLAHSLQQPEPTFGPGEEFEESTEPSSLASAPPQRTRVIDLR